MTFHRVRPAEPPPEPPRLWRRVLWGGLLVAAVAWPAGVVARQPDATAVDVLQAVVVGVLLVLAAAGQGGPAVRG